MKPSILDEIVRCRQALGERMAGKFLQCLLGRALVRAGYKVEEERTVEGPDLLVESYQIEAKTTTSEPFTIAPKDIQDIQAGIARGRVPALALLECSSFRGWTVARAEGLPEGSYRRRDLALRRITELERAANENFDAVVEVWGPLLSEAPEAAFDRMSACRKDGRWQP